METRCRICHPEQYDTTKDPDPQSYIEIDDTEYPTETSDSDEDSSDTTRSDDDCDVHNVGYAKGINRDEGKDEREHIVHNLDQDNNAYDSCNNPHTSDQTSVHKKGKRDTHNRNHKRGRGNRGKGNNRKSKSNGRKISISCVLMPDEKKYPIKDIVAPHWKCGRKTKLVTLGPNTKRRHKEFDIVEAVMQNTIIHHDNCESGGGCFDKYNIIKIQKILQGCAWRKYQQRKAEVLLDSVANERMLFHGTDAVWEIVSGGFDERFSSTNGQFGAGLYFAKHSSVANQFVFGYFGGNGCKLHNDKNCYICERHLLLCRVTLGKAYQLKTIENMPHPPPEYHSVEALTGKGAFDNPEYVIYRGEQAYPEYLITYKIVRPRDYKNEEDEGLRNHDVIRLIGKEHQHFDADHRNFGADHRNSGADHRTFTADHRNSDADHRTFGSYHRNSGADHRTFGADHRNSGADHRNSGADHRTFTADYRNSGADHRTFTADHRNSGADHRFFGADHRNSGTGHQNFDARHHF